MESKTNLKGALLGVVMTLLAFVASAKTEVSVYPYLKSPYSIVTLHNPTQANVLMEITDSFNEEVYFSRKMEELDFSQKLFDFSALENGYYKIVIYDKNETITFPFKVVDGAVLSSEVSEETAAESFVGVKDDLLIVSLYSPSLSAGAHLTLSDVSGERLHSQTLESKENSYTGAFNVRSLPKGDYYVRIDISGKEIKHDVQL